MEVKFLLSEDYDNLLTEIEKERENPFGLFKDIYLQNKERNPDFLQLSLNGIERKQKRIWEKWMQIDYSDSQMTLEGQVYKDPDFRFYESLKNFISELQQPIENQKEIEVQPPNKNVSSILTQQQFALLFYYLQKVGIISSEIKNKQITKSLQYITGYSFGRIEKIIKSQNEPSFKISQIENDFNKLKNKLKSVISEIEKDVNRFNKEGEIR